MDGFNISPWLIPTGLDDIVNHLVPELQERGVYPTEYAGTTLRENLGPAPPSAWRHPNRNSTNSSSPQHEWCNDHLTFQPQKGRYGALDV